MTELGRYEYTGRGMDRPFAIWRQELSKKFGAGQDVAAELLEGAEIVAGHRAGGDTIARHASIPHEETRRGGARRETLLAGDGTRADRSRATRYDRVLEVIVEPVRARFGAWYEMFPRSAGTDPVRSATFDEAAARLPYVAGMGFDVLYLPPIHPIGRSFRKGPNNTLTAGPDDPGSPWAIGGEAGGHKAVEPGLGTLEDFDRFVESGAAPAGSRSRSTSPSRLARSSLRQGASGVVPPAARRHDQVRREPAEEIPGHLSRSTSSRTTGRRSGTS